MWKHERIINKRTRFVDTWMLKKGRTNTGQRTWGKEEVEGNDESLEGGYIETNG